VGIGSNLSLHNTISGCALTYLLLCLSELLVVSQLSVSELNVCQFLIHHFLALLVPYFLLQNDRSYPPILNKMSRNVTKFWGKNARQFVSRDRARNKISDKVLLAWGERTIKPFSDKEAL
jgi:hypothetical protein